MARREMRVADLRAALRELGLATNGLKHELKQRLEEHLTESTSPAAAKRKRAATNAGPASNSKRPRRPSGGSQGQKVSAAFANYTDGDKIGPEEMVRLCADLGVEPEDPVMIALSYVMEAENLGEYSREEFTRGMDALECSSVEELAGRIDELRAMLDPTAPGFLKLYEFAYKWACEPGQKSIVRDVAMGLWPLLLRPMNFPLLDDFLAFLSKSAVRGVTRDLWMQMYHFIVQFKRAGNSLEHHDPDSGAWPVLIDEWVEHFRAKEAEGGMETC